MLEHPNENYLKYLIGERHAIQQISKDYNITKQYETRLYLRFIAVIYRYEQLGKLPGGLEINEVFRYKTRQWRKYLASTVEKGYVRQLNPKPFSKHFRGRIADVYEVTRQGQKLLHRFTELIDFYAL